MISVRLNSLRDTTRKLFLESCFDGFDLMEAAIHCAASFTVDGRCNKEFFSAEEASVQPPEPFVSWETLRPVCFQMIRGKRTPISFRLVFYLSKEKAARQFSMPELAQNADIDGFLFILHYKNQELTATTGTSFFRFSLDKDSERLWDRQILSWMDRQSLSYTDL